MVKTYYRNEYTEKQWKALIDKATELGCQVTYGRYGDRAEIDSTDRENAVLQSTGKSVDDCAARSFWAHDEQKQIDKMRELYDLLPVKPEWLTREQIDKYAAKMGVS